MNFPSKPNETERTGLVRKALQEAARYEAETTAPDDLVSRALTQHNRSGRRCDERGPVPVLVAGACGLILLAGAGLWLRTPHRVSGGQPAPAPVTAFQSGQKAALPASFALPRIDIAPALLPPIDVAKFVVSTGLIRHRHRITCHDRRHRLHLVLAQNRPSPTPMNPSHSVWTTETVHCEIVTQAVTPVWVAHADPTTATIVLTPALFRLALQPDNPSDPTETQVSATLIPVRFEQENDQP